MYNQTELELNHPSLTTMRGALSGKHYIQNEHCLLRFIHHDITHIRAATKPATTTTRGYWQEKLYKEAFIIAVIHRHPPPPPFPLNGYERTPARYFRNQLLLVLLLVTTEQR